MKVTQPAPPAEEVPAEVIATAIEKISTAMQALSATRLSRNALIVLIHDSSKLPKKTIALVLNNLETLERDWLKPRRSR